MSNEIWIISENTDLLAELITAGSEFGQVTALVAGPRTQAEQVASRGAVNVTWLGDVKSGGMIEDIVPVLAQLASDEKPSLILIGSTRQGRAIAGRLAACLGIDAVTDALQLEQDGDSFKVQHMIFGGGAIRTERVKASPAIVTIGSGVYPPQTGASGQAAQIRETPAVEPVWQVKVLERKPREKASVNLQAARRVVAAGRGIANQADLDMLKTLASLLSAEVGCTRPLAEGLDWLPRERYIGISGAHIKPDLYFGIGVSGQVQHMIGMNGSRVVMAVNKDTNAPIFSQADYGVVADLYELIPALIKALQARAGSS